MELEDDKIYELYYREVGQYPLISPKEERALLLRYHKCSLCKKHIPSKLPTTNCPECGSTDINPNSRTCVCNQCSARFDTNRIPKSCPFCGAARDMAAREKLTVSNLRFVVRRAKKFSTNPEHLKRLISAGNIGLLLAIDKFNIRRDTRFLTYAAWWIQKEMLDVIHSSPLIHIPTHKQKSLRKEQKEGKYICKHCHIRTNSPDNEPFTLCTEYEHEFVLPINKYGSVMREPQLVDDWEKTEKITTGGGVVETQAISEDMQNVLRKTLQQMELNERDKFIILSYFGIPKEDRQLSTKSLHQISELTGITPERVRQVKEQALELLRRELRKKSITQLEEIAV